ncbi:MAG: MarR family transcriptional regulator [Planctomycetota bacterium]|nr:MAG: MarR family transcriptional regulator [Planctomycetota bacterium]
MTRPRSPKATTISPRKFDSVEQSAYLNLWRTYDLLKAYEDRLFSEYDLSAQQYNTLRLLKAVHPGRVPTLELGTRLVSRAPDMTRLLDRLEARGLIDRERLPENRRVVEIGITPEGVKLLSTLSRQVTECHSRQLGHMNAEELEMLNRLLDLCRQPHEPPDSHWPKTM